MTRSQSVLLAVLVVLVALLVGRVAGPLTAALLGPVRTGLADALSATGAVPAWVWWAAAGSLWWLPWAGCGRGRRSCAARPTS